MPEFFVPLFGFLFLGSVILVPLWFNHRHRVAGLRLLEKSMERGETLDPALLDRIAQPALSPLERARRWLNLAVLSSALAAGIAAIHFMVGTTRIHSDGRVEFDGPLPASAFLLCMAAGFAVLWLVHRPKPGSGADPQ